MKRIFLIGMVVAFLSTSALADEVTVKLYQTSKFKRGVYVGKITARDTSMGLLISPNLERLPPGVHGFHVHTIGSCKNGGEAAGPHYDPTQTGKHRGPYSNNGHLGDLPVLIVGKNGRSKLTVLAPRLKVKDIRGRALIIHEGSDNYSDFPKDNGGGGARIACGVVPK